MGSGSARMAFAIKSLRERWDVANELWDDKVSRDFEKLHVVHLEHLATTAARGMDKIAEMMQKVRQECS